MKYRQGVSLAIFAIFRPEKPNFFLDDLIGKITTEMCSTDPQEFPEQFSIKSENVNVWPKNEIKNY